MFFHDFFNRSTVIMRSAFFLELKKLIILFRDRFYHYKLALDRGASLADSVFSKRT